MRKDLPSAPEGPRGDWVWDRRWPDHVRQLTDLDLERRLGGEQDEAARSPEALLRWPGRRSAEALLVVAKMAADEARQATRSEPPGHVKAGFCGDPEADARDTELLLWLEAWDRGHYQRSPPAANDLPLGPVSELSGRKCGTLDALAVEDTVWEDAASVDGSSSSSEW